MEKANKVLKVCEKHLMHIKIASALSGVKMEGYVYDLIEKDIKRQNESK
jgi:hypothetical protein